MRKNYYVLATVCLSLTLVVSMLTFVPFASFGSAQNSNCSPTIVQSIVTSKSESLNRPEAISLAELSLSSVAGLIPSATNFSSISNSWSNNAATCTATWKSVNVVFAATFRNGSEGYLVVSENPDLTRVLSIHFQQPVGTAGTNQWSGYQFQANNKGVTQVVGYWTIPAVSVPPTNSNCFDGITYFCALVNWMGESSGAGLTGTWGQGGSDSFVICTGGIFNFCAPGYNLWYEFSNDAFGANVCGSANAGDTMWSDQSYSIGTIYLFIYDLNNGVICQQSWANRPQMMYAQITGEIPQVGCCNSAYLPKFSSAYYFWDAEVNTYPISNSGACPCDAQPMNLNNGNPNINLGPLLYGSYLFGYFTETWVTSAGT